MNDDLIERLRENKYDDRDGCRVRKGADELNRERNQAADRIEQLEAEAERLREALVVLRDLPIVENDNPDTLHLDGSPHTGPVVDYLFRIIRKIKEVARAALEGKQP